MGILWNPISANSNGGTELLCRRLEAAIPAELLSEFQIIPSRLYGELDETKVRILYLHDLPGDPESDKIFADNGWQKFHKIVCVSNWQMQRYSERYSVPPSAFLVLPNSIFPIQRKRPLFSGEKIKFVYHTTPHRGLDILYHVFDQLSKTYPNIELDVFSSFKAYGWDDRDAQFQPLFDAIKDHPNMTWHGFMSNDVVRDFLAEADVFAYPNTWPETSCMALMEAMSAGLVCFHPNLAALFETAGNWTMMYQFQEQPHQHANVMMGLLEGFLSTDDKTPYLAQAQNAAQYANIFYNWQTRQRQWVDILKNLVELPRGFPEPVFTYRA